MQRFHYLIPYLIWAACVGGGWLWHQGDLVQSQPRVVTTGEPQVGGPFVLVDQNGAERTDKDFRGKYMLVFFGFTYCPDVCPTTLSVITEALDRLGAKADRIAPIFISVDPERDTPDVLKAYLSAFGPRFVGLTGTPEQIADVAKTKYHVYYAKQPIDGGTYTINHSSYMYLMDADGNYLTNYTLEIGPDKLAEDLAKRIR